MLKKKLTAPLFYHCPLFWAFLLSFLYLLYVGYLSEMILVNDSIGYEHLGRTISYQGWTEYFQSGPNREPFYPSLIALSLKISDLSGISYLAIQKVIQIILLILTQVLTLILLKKLKIKPLLCAAVVFYIGISPGLVNSALSLYSEIATYVLILGVVLLNSKSIEKIFNGSSFSQMARWGMLLGFNCVLITLTKAIFELISFFILSFYLITAGFLFFKKNHAAFKRALIFLCVFFLTFQSFVTGYKSLNKKYNGHFALTDRGPWALYGTTARRMEPLNRERVLTAIAYIPDEQVCIGLFGAEKCEFWSWRVSDKFGQQKANELNEHLGSKEVDQQLLKLSKEKILKNPFQYTLLMGIEALKMMFWESTDIGFVVYPDWLERLFRFPAFKFGLKFLVGFITFFALIDFLYFLWKNPKISQKENTFLWSIALILFPFILLHSFFLILPRYNLPIASLYLVIIVYRIQKSFLTDKTSAALR